jgi:A-kinase anchor protein 14
VAAAPPVPDESVAAPASELPVPAPPEVPAISPVPAAPAAPAAPVVPATPVVPAAPVVPAPLPAEPAAPEPPARGVSPWAQAPIEIAQASAIETRTVDSALRRRKQTLLMRT